ncbi:MAG: DUF1877 family protein [Candidatus Binatia bacterium]
MGTKRVRHAYFVAMTPAEAARLRRVSSAATTLREGALEETGIGHYWHGMQYLLAGRAKGVRGPLAWLTGGGEKLGGTPGGPIRYLSPEQVRRLSTVLDETEADDLGDDLFDEAAMDAAGVYPGNWVRNGETFDQLGTMRELYSYLRDFLARQARAGNGVAITMTLEPAPEEDPGTMTTTPPSPGAAVFAGATGRTYERIEGKPQKALDETFAGLGYRPLGDMTVLPVLAGSVVRTYRADDGTAVAACVIGPDRVASTTFLALLGKDAVLVISDAFVLEKPKKRVFATMMSTAKPADLEATLRERRAALEKKHGAAVIMPAELASAAKAWEAWWAKQAG